MKPGSHQQWSDPTLTLVVTGFPVSSDNATLRDISPGVVSGYETPNTTNQATWRLRREVSGAKRNDVLQAGGQVEPLYHWPFGTPGETPSHQVDPDPGSACCLTKGGRDIESLLTGSDTAPGSTRCCRRSVDRDRYWHLERCSCAVTHVVPDPV